MRRTRPWFVVVGLLLVTGPLAAGWQSEGPYLAIVSDVAIAPGDSQTLYSGVSAGGVWRSDDGGATWQPSGSELAGWSVEWLEVDPTDSNVVWAGVASRGATLWRSTDGGGSWAAIDATYDGGVGRVQPTGNRIAFAAPSTIYVPSTNLHYRSDDGGTTWTSFRVPNQDAYTIAVHPDDPMTVLAGGRGSSLNLSRSTDGGKTWRQTGIGLGDNSLKQMVYDPADPAVVYALGGTFGVVFKSTDGGDEWTELSLPVGGTTKVFSLTVAPTGGTVWAATQRGVMKSTDGGASWADSDRGFGRYLCKRVVFDPSNPSQVFAATAGSGVYASVDGGSSWSSSSVGLAGGKVEALYGAPGSSVVFAQMSAGLFRGGNGSWAEVKEPFESSDAVDIAGIVFDRKSTKTLYAFDSSKYWRSTDGGSSWKEVEQKGPSMRDMMRGSMDSAQFASFVQDPGNAKTFYAGSWSNDQGVYKTTDGGKKWKPAADGLPGDEKVSWLASEASGEVFAVIDDSVYRTANGGKSWSAVGAGLPDGDVFGLAVDPTSPKRVFVATEGGLFVSGDGGGSWQRAAGVAGDEVRAVAVDPASGRVFAGSSDGIFSSTDGGASWTSIVDDLPNSDVRTIAIAGSPARLWAGTHGGSVFSTELP